MYVSWPRNTVTIICIFIYFISMAAPGMLRAEQLSPPVSESRQEDSRPNLSEATLEVKKNQLSSENGWRAGTFTIKPEVVLTEAYDDNIFATRTNEVNDTITIFSPSVWIKSDWKKHELNLGASLDAASYDTNSNENYSDYYLTTDGKFIISPSANIFGGIELSQKHEERSSLDDINGIEPTTYKETSGHLGFYKKFNNVSLRLGGTIDQLDFDNVDNLAGLINDDRDRTEQSFGARISYRLNPRYEPYLQAIYVKRSYDLDLDDNLFNRDSDGYRAAVGVHTKIDNQTSAEFYLGYLKQDYDDNALSDVSTVDFGMNFTSKINPRTTVKVALDRSLEETTVNSASSYLYTVASANTNHKLSSKYSLDFDFSYSESDYEGISRTDNELLASIGMKYYLNRNVFLTASYRLLNRKSDIPGADYYRNQAYLGIGGLLYPVRNSRRSQVKSSNNAFIADSSLLAGFYSGIQFGHGVLATETSGPRGGGGFDYGEFGRDGNTEGLFFGYGTHLNHWYLGAEFEADDSHVAWFHSKDKTDSRTFNVQKNSSYGLSVRAGYLLNDGKLLYGRYGKVKTDFQTFYTVNSLPLNAVDQEYSTSGHRYGFGVEIPEFNHLFWRMEYTFTDYDNYNVNYVTNTENFDNRESLFRIGLGWRFAGHKPVAKKLSTSDYSGFFLGANVGHGSLNTSMTGLHRSGGQGPFDFDADFSSYGFNGGFFAGYGFVMNKLYLALEMDAEASRAGWRHDRVTGGPGGRDFSVDKKGGYGGSIRVGYILPSHTMLYLRAGRAQTKFNTRYVKGANAATWIDRDDKQWGDRYGMGIEIPVYKKAFLRMDYSLTNYDDYDFTTTHGGNPDYNKFDNSENMFMLGIGMRF